MKRFLYFILVIVYLFIFVKNLFGASIEKAELFYLHNLYYEAKIELINLVTENSDPNRDINLKAYYLLGEIAYSEDNHKAAIDSWLIIFNDYPDSEYARLIEIKLKYLTEIYSASNQMLIENMEADTYMKNAEFWLKKKDAKFIIETGRIPSIEAGIKWYDKIIEDFPKTQSAKAAYYKKMMALIIRDKEENNFYGISNFYDIYLPTLVETFNNYVNDFPNSSLIPAFKYQIAQVYWDRNNFKQAYVLLNEIITDAGENETFYKDLAVRKIQLINPKMLK